MAIILGQLPDTLGVFVQQAKVSEGIVIIWSSLGHLIPADLGHAHSGGAIDSRLAAGRGGFCLLLSFYVAPGDVHEVGHRVHLESQEQPACENEKHLDDQVSITACN